MTDGDGLGVLVLVVLALGALAQFRDQSAPSVPTETDRSTSSTSGGTDSVPNSEQILDAARSTDAISDVVTTGNLDDPDVAGSIVVTDAHTGDTITIENPDGMAGAEGI